MKHGRFTKIAVRATALAALLLGMAALSVLERRRTQAELGAVLSAFFSDAVLRDMLAVEDDSMNLAARAFDLS
jgi:hypothetical protein